MILYVREQICSEQSKDLVRLAVSFSSSPEAPSSRIELDASSVLSFSVENFIDQAMGDGIQLAASVKAVRTAAGDSLLDVMQDLEGDMLDEGVDVPD